MKWIPVKFSDINDVPTNTDLLITDGYEVYVGFLSSMLEWHIKDQEICNDIDFFVSHWMEFPKPPCN